MTVPDQELVERSTQTRAERRAASRPPRRKPGTESILSAIAMVAVSAFIALGFWPGRMNADTLNEISQARIGIYTDQYSPIIQAIWHPLFGAGLTPGVVLLGQILLFVVSAYLILRLTFRPRYAALWACLIAIYPPIMGTLGLLGRDTWFLSFTVLGFGLVARATVKEGGERSILLVGAVVAVWFALAARQNAAAAGIVVVGLTLAYARYGRSRGLSRPASRLWAVITTTALALLITLVMMLSQAVIVHALSVKRVHPVTPLQIYDLARLSLADGRNYFPPSVLKDRSLVVIARSDVNNMVPLLFGPGAIRVPYTGQEAAAINRAWAKRLKADPLGYLRERTHLFLHEVGVEARVPVSYHRTVDANPWNYRTTFPTLNRIANDYLGLFANSANEGDVLYSAWIYFGAAAALSVALLVRISWRKAVFAAVAFSSLTYEIGLFFGAIGTGYRYQFPGVSMTVIAVVGGLPLLFGLRRNHPKLAEGAEWTEPVVAGRHGHSRSLR